MRACTKKFEFVEGSTVNMWYAIKVYYRGDLVQDFVAPTMEAAYRKFEAAGYKVND